MKSIAIVSINEIGFEASLKLSDILNEFEITNFNRQFDEKNFVKYQKLDDILESLFGFDAIIFFLATGIVIRKIAPFLKSKESDPAILILNFELTRVIPLLSGHLGGANELAQLITDRCSNCINFITTATDQSCSFAFDNFAKDFNYKIVNIKNLAKISNLLINNQNIEVFSYESIFKNIKKYKNFNEKLFLFKNINSQKTKDSVVITPQYVINSQESLQIKIQKINLGIGSNRGIDIRELNSAIEEFLFEHNLEFNQIDSISTFRAKADEKALIEFTKLHSIELKIFDENEINNLDMEFSNSQATKFFNIKGVAEPCAILGSIEKELFLKKHIYGNITIASAF